MLHRRAQELIETCTCIKIELEFRVLVFVEGGKPENPEKNPRSKDENQQQTQSTYDAGSGIKPGPHWWEVSALTTAPPLLPTSAERLYLYTVC